MIKTNRILAALLLGAVTAPLNASPVYTYTFQTSDANLGVSHSYGVVPYDITVYGFDGTSMNSPNTATELSETASGMGLEGSSRISTGDFVTIDFADPETVPGSAAAFEVGDLSSGEGWALYGSDTLGDLGTAITSNTAGWGLSGNTWETIPDLSDFTYYSLRAVNESTYGLMTPDCGKSSPNITLMGVQVSGGTTTPEPGTCMMVGLALIGLSLGTRRLSSRKH